MPIRNELESWVCDALRAADGRADRITILRFIWENHEPDLRAAGRRFYTWQLDTTHTLSSLKRRGLIRRAEEGASRGIWEIVGDLTNAFESMCRKASAERWCWNLACTTCGNLDFRQGLIQIALGRHPASHDWCTFDTVNENAPAPPHVRYVEDLPLSMKNQLSETLAGASLEDTARQCRFPDWLAFLGVALSFTEQDEQLSSRLTRSWLPQLRQMVEWRSEGRRRLDEIRESGEPLRWHHLDGLEGHIRAEYQSLS